MKQCNEECCRFRWNKCETKNEDGTCDKPNLYDYGEDIYPELDITEKDRTKIRIRSLLNMQKEIENDIKGIIFDYAKMEGLLPVSRELKDGFDYKKVIREEFGLVV